MDAGVVWQLAASARPRRRTAAWSGGRVQLRECCIARHHHNIRAATIITIGGTHPTTTTR